MRVLKLLIKCTFVACVVIAWARAASAQQPRPGYSFVEVLDESKRPVISAAIVVYNESGDEVGSSLTDPEGKAPLFKKSTDGRKRFVVRIVKPGYLTYEGVFGPSKPDWWANDETKVELIRVSKHKTRAVRSSKRDAEEKPLALASGLSPPRGSWRSPTYGKWIPRVCQTRRLNRAWP